jgi:hypothetical protein
MTLRLWALMMGSLMHEHNAAPLTVQPGASSHVVWPSRALAAQSALTDLILLTQFLASVWFIKM